MTHSSVKRIVFCITILWFLNIWVLSSLPAKKLPTINVLSIDKLLHITEYLVLGLLVNRCIKMSHVKPKLIVLIYLIVLTTAALDEWHQHLIPNRSVSFWDFAANAVGLALSYSFLRFRNDRSKQVKA